MHPILLAVAELKRLYPAPQHADPLWRQLLGMIAGTLLLAVFFRFVETVWPDDPTQHRTARDQRIDLFYWFFDSLVARAALIGAACVVVGLILLRVPHHPTWITSQPLWAQAIEALIVGDFTGYWFHRAMHRVPWLWRIHALHHSPQQLNWLAAARIHPLETLLQKALSIAPMFLLGFSPGVVAFYGPFTAVYPIFIHANIKWDYGIFRHVIASPWFHRWHHSSDPKALDKNFAGLLPLWDFIFGSAYLPVALRPESYGLAGETAPHSILKQMFWPFAKKPSLSSSSTPNL